MAEYLTPPLQKIKSRLCNNPENQSPLKIPATPYLKQIGYGCGVNVFTLERSPKVGFARSPWAIKKRNSKDIKDVNLDKRIKLEADILKALNHPNIIGFRALTLSKTGAPCLAMEQLDQSLGDLIEERVEMGEDPFKAKDIEHVSYEIAKGLEYLHHTCNILHGDLKSYNILISKNMKIVKLCDFGVAVPVTEDLIMKEGYYYTGTEVWNAPEVISEEGPITNKTDMWAYGLIIWEMIALSPPHVDHDENLDESDLDQSIIDMDTSMKDDKNFNISSMNDSDIFPSNNKLGTRPALPAIEIGPEYDDVLQIFILCTDQDQTTRPSAKGVVMYFKNYILQSESKSKATTKK
ncbi:lymphokine-activated killer T-cell-originated protein kinase [Chelonus insularis]|uniref:lymphokine-activated killer T-cell-originated protein kinase n=1 Tax=Chelonus insularis TaxID=460826 RepID=UPI00158D5C19|nr:lymphokine-activated killer T-cell-originated protein kinase [Chelonus insularis]